MEGLELGAFPQGLVGFRADRMWIMTGSANYTTSSRPSIDVAFAMRNQNTDPIVKEVQSWVDREAKSMRARSASPSP